MKTFITFIILMLTISAFSQDVKRSDLRVKKELTDTIHEFNVNTTLKQMRKRRKYERVICLYEGKYISMPNPYYNHSFWKDIFDAMPAVYSGGFISPGFYTSRNAVYTR